MEIEDVFEEYPVMYILTQTLDAARAAAIVEVGGVTDPDDYHDETNDYFFLINEKIVNDALNRLQDRLCDPAWRILRDCDDLDAIRREMVDAEPWARDANHAIRLICLYGACLRQNRKMAKEANLSAHELLNIRAKEAAFLAQANEPEWRVGAAYSAATALEPAPAG
jgi:hypothetical protein